MSKINLAILQMTFATKQISVIILSSSTYSATDNIILSYGHILSIIVKIKQIKTLLHKVTSYFYTHIILPCKLTVTTLETLINLLTKDTKHIDRTCSF